MLLPVRSPSSSHSAHGGDGAKAASASEASVATHSRASGCLYWKLTLLDVAGTPSR